MLPAMVDKQDTLVKSPFKTAGQKAAERAEKRDAVLRAAVRMFNERGFYLTSLDEVAASLGISKRTIYHYLSSKDQVLLECVTIGLNQLMQALERARSEPGTGRDRLEKFLRQYAEINMEDFGRCVIRTSEDMLAKESLPKFQAMKKHIDKELRTLIQEGQDDGSIAHGDPKLIAFTLAGALNWPARWHRADGGMPASSLAAEMVDILMHGLIPPPAAGGME